MEKLTSETTSPPSTYLLPPLIFVLAGQSDMVGRGVPEDLPDELLEEVAQNQVSMCYDIDRNGTEGAGSTSSSSEGIPSFHPLARRSQWSNAGGCYSHGPEWGIVKALIPHIRAQRRRVYLIKFAMGSTSLQNHWNADPDASSATFFPEFVAYIQAALEEIGRLEKTNDERRITALFWLQGHSDASGRAEMRANYRSNFLKFVKGFRDGLCTSEQMQAEYVIPIIACQLTWLVREGSKSDKKFYRRMQLVNDALRGACGQLENAEFAAFDVETEGKVTCHKDGHSDTGGLLLLGEGMGRTFLEIFGDSIGEGTDGITAVKENGGMKGRRSQMNRTMQETRN